MSPEFKYTGLDGVVQTGFYGHKADGPDARMAHELAWLKVHSSGGSIEEVPKKDEPLCTMFPHKYSAPLARQI